MDLNAIKLSDGFVYAIANKVKYNNKKYVQLIRVDDKSGFFFAENVGKELIVVEDDNLKLALIQEIANAMQQAVNNIKNPIKRNK